MLLFAGTLLFLYKKSQADPVVFQTESPFRADIGFSGDGFNISAGFGLSF